MKRPYSSIVRTLTVLSMCMGGPLAALDVNNTGNDVFDLYFFGNGENGLFGTTTGISWQDEPRKTTGNVKDSSTYYWSDDLKQAMLNAVNTWTSAIATPYDTEKHDRKLRIGFFLDDGSTAGGYMQTGMAGYAAYQTVSTNDEEKYGTSANSYTVAEWAWRDNNETDYLAPPSNMASGTYWETDVLSDEWNSIDIAIVLNPVVSTEYGFDAYGNFYYNQTARTIEEMQNVATHEIGHGMGMNSKLYKAGGTLSGMVTTWDSLLTLDGANIVTVTNGQAEPTFETLTALHNAAWEVGEGKDPTKSDSYTGDEIQYDPDRRLSLNGEVGVHIAALLLEGDTLVHISAEDGSNVLGPGGRMNSEFSESDLRALELLGWSVRRNDSIPEPTSGALCMLGLSALAMRRRRH